LYKKADPTARFEQLELVANEWFEKAVKKDKDTIAEYTERIQKNKKKDPLEEDIVKKYTESLKWTQEIQTIYLQLKERYKHNSIEERLKIYQDWYDFTEALHDLNFAHEMLEYDWEDGAYDRYDESIKEPRIKMLEIEKRFKKMSNRN
jgi:hypothetical protein